ncbi:hypothetical protein JUNP254_1701 [Klebsiella pneumoniae]|nr:hypothetical protein JUNP254_1701 [Klebsiella pneumoniae]
MLCNAENDRINAITALRVLSLDMNDFETDFQKRLHNIVISKKRMRYKGENFKNNGNGSIIVIQVRTTLIHPQKTPPLSKKGRIIVLAFSTLPSSLNSFTERLKLSTSTPIILLNKKDITSKAIIIIKNRE